MRLKSIFTLTLLLGLGACASIKKEDCQKADWGGLGFDDAVNGNSVYEGKLPEYKKKCAEHGVPVSPDSEKAYKDAHEQGVKKYCTEAEAKERGKKGAKNNASLCGDNEGIEKAYKKGRKDYLLGKARNLERDLSAKESEIRRLRVETSRAARGGAEAYRKHLDRIDRAESERSSIESDLRETDREIATLAI